ncbi:neuroglobin [Exaiptasia diaphana]|uniref:Globin domain-containing protein n=1 Tax=Exaiptasia diaphana TaxID=2652724 RepID=A0A913Y4A1_EXADI|nr:neuroglobin [Exaiptasia diaphana]XP_028518971.1 neuroglobin [Exaiptasia diaphana]
MSSLLRRISKSLASLIWGDEEPVLDDNQIQLIRNSWEKVEKGDLQETGLVVFKRLFEIAPYLRDRFPFGHNPESKGLRTHALGVMETVGVAVKNLDNPVILKNKLLELGQFHKPFGLTDTDYQNVGAAILWTLAAGLGEDFTPETKDAWGAAYGYIQKTMEEGSQ